MVYLIQKAFLNLIHFFVYTSLFVFHFLLMFHQFFMFKEYIFYEPVIQNLWFYVNDGFPILLLKQMAQFYIDNCQLKNFFGKKKLFVTFLEIKRTADYSCLTTHT